jgi:hypothetical protein
MSATLAIQTAIYGVLSADATLAGLSLSIDTSTGAVTTVAVYNDVPDGATYPHVLISDSIERPWHRFGGATTGIGWYDTVRLHIYSRYQGDKEAYQIRNRLVAMLNFQPLTVSGFSGSMVEYKPGRLLREAVEKIETRHVVDELHVKVH